jgi:hypothetical protein
MLTSRPFLFGVVVGLGGLWAFHHWVKPLPAAKGS